VDINIVWEELMGLYGRGNARGSRLYAPLAVTAIWACLGARELNERRIACTLTVSGFLLVLFAAIGAAIYGASNLQPNRFAPVGYLLMNVPATIGLIDLLKRARGPENGWSIMIARIGLVLAMAVGVYAVNEVRREISYSDIGHYGVRPPEVKGLGDYSKWVLNWLERETTSAGRVLFEDSKSRIYDGAHLAGYYAYKTGREFIGGPLPFQHFAGFWDSWLFSKPIEKIDHEDFPKYMDLYNVGWIIAHSDETKHYLEQIPEIIPSDEFGGLKTYRIRRSLSYFIEGEGHILERSHNKLVLSDLSGEVIIIKYHYIPGLRTEPFAKIVPVQFMDDPNPFIEILNPPRQIVLFLP